MIDLTSLNPIVKLRLMLKCDPTIQRYNSILSDDIPTINMEVYNDLLEILGEDLHELADDFLLDTPPQLTLLSSSVNESNFDEIFKIAHFLIGSSGNLGLENFCDICDKLCLQAKEKNIESCIMLEKSLVKNFSEAKALLTEKLNNI